MKANIIPISEIVRRSEESFGVSFDISLPLNLRDEEQEPRMSSREIAELLQTRHCDLLRCIDSLLKQGVSLRRFVKSNYLDSQGKTQREFLVDFRGVMLVATRYDALLREKLIDRWYELERIAREAVTPKDILGLLKLTVRELEKSYEKENALRQISGFSETWMQAIAVPYLEEFFTPPYSIHFFSDLGKALSKLSRGMGYEIKKASHSKYKNGVGIYHKDVVEAYRKVLLNDTTEMRKYRNGTERISGETSE